MTTGTAPGVGGVVEMTDVRPSQPRHWHSWHSWHSRVGVGQTTFAVHVVGVHCTLSTGLRREGARPGPRQQGAGSRYIKLILTLHPPLGLSPPPPALFVTKRTLYYNTTTPLAIAARLRKVLSLVSRFVPLPSTLDGPAPQPQEQGRQQPHKAHHVRTTDPTRQMYPDPRARLACQSRPGPCQVP